MREIWRSWSQSRKGPLRIIEGLENLSHEGSLRVLKLFNLENRRLRGDLIIVYKYLNRESKEYGARFFSVVPSDRRRSNEPQLKHRRFSLSIRKHIFTVRVIEHSYRLPREVVEPPSLEIFKSHLDMVLGNQL